MVLSISAITSIRDSLEDVDFVAELLSRIDRLI